MAMLGRGNAGGRIWELLPILLLVSCVAQPSVAAQTLSIGNLLNGSTATAPAALTNSTPTATLPTGSGSAPSPPPPFSPPPPRSSPPPPVTPTAVPPPPPTTPSPSKTSAPSPQASTQAATASVRTPGSTASSPTTASGTTRAPSPTASATPSATNVSTPGVTAAGVSTPGVTAASPGNSGPSITSIDLATSAPSPTVGDNSEKNTSGPVTAVPAASVLAPTSGADVTADEGMQIPAASPAQQISAAPTKSDSTSTSAPSPSQPAAKQQSPSQGPADQITGTLEAPSPIEEATPAVAPALSPAVESATLPLVPTPAPGLNKAVENPAPAPQPKIILPAIPSPAPQLKNVLPAIPSPAPGNSPSPSEGLAPSSYLLSPSEAPVAASQEAAVSEPLEALGPGAPSQIAFSQDALAPSLENNLVFATGAPLAASPSHPSWLTNAEKIGTDLYYTDVANNTGFYTVIQQPNGTETATYAFATVPQGTNYSSYQPNNVAIGLLGYDIYPFNETYQAALMNQLHIALDNADIGHVITYTNTTNNTASSSGSTRRLLQSNSDGITSTVGDQNQSATLTVQTQSNVTVNVVVSVLPADRDNLTAIVNEAISDGQVRRGLLQAGANVTNATVTGVSAISSGTNSNLTPGTANTASPSPQSSGGANGGVIGGAVGGGCAAVLILGLILYRVHTQKLKKRMADLEASPASKLTDSSSEEGYPYHRNGRAKYPHSSTETSDSGDRPHYIKTMRGGMQDIMLLSNGTYNSMDSPYANSVQPKDLGSERTSPDSPGWEAYRQKILTGIEKAATKNTLSHKIDANLWQVQWADVDLQDEIGGGSYGKVHIAKWRETTVAVKVLGSGVIPEDKRGQSNIEHSTLLNLEKEASMMASMRHPNVVMYIGVCLEVPALVTEYCARGSLHDVLRKWKGRPELVVNWSRRIGMVLDAAKGMNYLHSGEPPVIHRDLKSPNLLVDKHWNVKICDFNLSKAIEENTNLMSSLGTTNPRWLAPEILSGKDYSFSSDVYSFGLIMWEMLTWTVPWNEISHWQCVHVVTEQRSRPEIPAEEDLPGPEEKKTFSGFAEYVELMQQCWDHDPESRPKFPHVIEVLRRLMATEAGHRDGRSSMSLGTDQQSSSGLFSLGQSSNNQTSLGGRSLDSSNDGQSLGPSQHNSKVMRQSLITGSRNPPREAVIYETPALDNPNSDDVSAAQS